jgi:DNA-binding CsgD family transcriptional regulator
MFVAVANIVGCIIGDPTWFQYIFNVALLVVISCAFYFLRKIITFKVLAYLYVAFSVLSILLGEHDSLTGAIFVCFAIYVFDNNRIRSISILLVALATLLKAVFASFSIPQTMHFIAGNAFIITIFWLLIMKPSKPVVTNPDDYETAEIVKYMIDGLSYKEISERLICSESAISKKLERARKKAGVKSNIHLAIILSRSGQIVLE